MFCRLAILSILTLSTAVYATRPRANNIVSIVSKSKFCMIMPKTAHTDIGASEHPGGMTTYCSSEARYSNAQGTFPRGFWTKVEYKARKNYVQLTGCINPTLVDRLNPGDDGGQYDSSGGDGGHGNPAGSVCLGYNHYVEIVEPAGNRACIRCCNNPADCPTNKDTQGCLNVIPGNYFHCL